MVHPLAGMAYSVHEIIVGWMKKHSAVLTEYMVLLMLEDEGLDIRECFECLTLLKNHGFFYSPHLGKIALVR